MAPSEAVKLLEVVSGIAVVLALAALTATLRLSIEVRRVRRAAAALDDRGLYGLDQLLREQDLKIRQIEERGAEFERRLMRTDERVTKAIRHVSVLRFNPFRDAGGDQSFSIAMLDDEGAGVVLTGLHARSETRVYAKPVRSGGSTYPLSEEELMAIREADDGAAGTVNR